MNVYSHSSEKSNRRAWETRRWVWEEAYLSCSQPYNPQIAATASELLQQQQQQQQQTPTALISHGLKLDVAAGGWLFRATKVAEADICAKG
ncbi:unnamed protein product [Ceratitis capitata]|uniref:(Mediterranean fruit fly) hypothetical protein n=1 Tax=Ceratitis capitata TaxID=7213 RepID=A0A811UQF8_CERCA|nr:unnamed protein product [Ceratitis capitata]